ncbi:MAG TPA: GNVR domain-containing protein, partial [Gemmatimonadaceae bacterium]|nr:GNVR domain-containing protein [Gemmatimonadaceae bacterium]
LSAGMAAGGGALGGLASQLGMAAGGDPSESANFYFELIQSRELITRLLQSRFPNPRTSSPGDSATLLDILRIRHEDPRRRLEIAIKRMAAAIDGNYDTKTNLVWIEVDAQWPELSAGVANRTIDLVTAFNREQRVSRAKSKRLFLEGRVGLARESLRSAEARHRSFYEQNRSWRTSPALIFEEKQLQRDVDQTADLYTMLQRQLETALLDEVNDAALITVVDSAVPARKAQWPRYGILLVSTVIAGSLLGLMIAGGAAILADWRSRNPDSAAAFGDSMGRVRHEIRRVFRRAS